jgi:hypothetical protein
MFERPRNNRASVRHDILLSVNSRSVASVGVPTEGAEPWRRAAEDAIVASASILDTSSGCHLAPFYSFSGLAADGCTTAICDNGDNNTTAPRNLFPAHALLRSQRLRDLLAAIAEWARASGPDRAWWRRDALWRLAEWRRIYAVPERRAFLAACAASQHRRTAA